MAMRKDTDQAKAWISHSVHTNCNTRNIKISLRHQQILSTSKVKLEDYASSMAQKVREPPPRTEMHPREVYRWYKIVEAGW